MSFLAPKPRWQAQTLAVDLPNEALFALFCGMMATFLVNASGPLLLPIQAPGFPGFLLRAFLHAALPEEAAKCAALLYCLRRSAAGVKPLHAMALGALVGLGFAGVETVVYGFRAGAPAASLRVFTAIPCHLFLGVLSGYYCWAARQSAVAVNAAKALLLPVLLHGLYDLPLMAASMAVESPGGAAAVPAGLFEHALLLSAMVLFLLAAWARYFLKHYSRAPRRS